MKPKSVFEAVLIGVVIAVSAAAVKFVFDMIQWRELVDNATMAHLGDVRILVVAVPVAAFLFALLSRSWLPIMIAAYVIGSFAWGIYVIGATNLTTDIAITALATGLAILSARDALAAKNDSTFVALSEVMSIAILIACVQMSGIFFKWLDVRRPEMFAAGFGLIVAVIISSLVVRNPAIDRPRPWGIHGVIRGGRR